MVDHFAQLATHPLVYLALPPTAYNNSYQISGTVIHDQIVPILEQVAAAKGIPTIDVNTTTAGHPELFPDGVHPNDDGYKLVAQVMYAGLLSPGDGGFGGGGGEEGASGGAAGGGGVGGGGGAGGTMAAGAGGATTARSGNLGDAGPLPGNAGAGGAASGISGGTSSDAGGGGGSTYATGGEGGAAGAMGGAGRGGATGASSFGGTGGSKGSAGWSAGSGGAAGGGGGALPAAGGSAGTTAASAPSSGCSCAVGRSSAEKKPLGSCLLCLALLGWLRKRLARRQSGECKQPRPARPIGAANCQQPVGLPDLHVFSTAPGFDVPTMLSSDNIHPPTRVGTVSWVTSGTP